MDAHQSVIDLAKQLSATSREADRYVAVIMTKDQQINALVKALENIIKLDTCISDGGKRHDHGLWAGLAIGALMSAGLTTEVTSADGGTAT